MAFHAARRLPPLLAGLATCFYAVTAALAAPDCKEIVGDWDSNFGPVHVDFIRGERPPGSAMIGGYWREPPHNQKGEITDGHYTVLRGGELSLAYIETWSKHRGKAVLKLDSSGKKFSGTFKNDDGYTGTWTWTRQ